MAQKLLDKDGNAVKRGDDEIYTTNSANGLVQVKGVNVEKRQLTIIGTDETRDRDGDIIKLNGWDVSNYLKNPVFIWAHDYKSVPLAAAIKVIRKREPRQMWFTHQFAPEGIYPFADMILQLYTIRQINAGSVGFIPFKWRDIVKEDIGDDYDEDKEKLYWKPRIYLQQELLEHSGCPVPSNPSALQNQMKSFNIPKGVNADHVVDYLLGKKYPEVDEKRLTDIKGEIEEIKQKTEFIDETEATIYQVTDDIKSEDEEKEILEQVSYDEVKPYKNEHACRIKEPNFDQYARSNCKIKHDGKCIDVIYGIKDGVSTIQAYRFNKSVWTVSAARSYCKDKGGIFEPAKESMLTGGVIEDDYIYFDDDICINIEELQPFIDIAIAGVRGSLDGEQLRVYYETLEKAGAVLNKKNKDLLKNASDNIMAVLASAETADENDDEKTIDDTVSTEVDESAEKSNDKSNTQDEIVSNDRFDIILDKENPLSKTVSSVTEKTGLAGDSERNLRNLTEAVIKLKEVVSKMQNISKKG